MDTKQKMEKRKNRIKGGILAIIGYILSPLSWWNDIFINIPLAYLFALPFSLISKKLFLPFIIIGYWLTNIIGFILMHIGVKDLISKKERGYNKKELIKDLLISITYTIIIIVLVKIGWLRLPLEYFK